VIEVPGLSSHLDAAQISIGRAGHFGDGTDTCPVCSADRARVGIPARSSIREVSREQSIRLAVLLLFCDPVPEQCSQLIELSEKDWKRLTRWLDQSGLALYFLDYPNAGYAETVTIKDAATGFVLDTRSVSAFTGGVYEVWTVSGNITVTLTSTAGHWAVLSGIFFK